MSSFCFVSVYKIPNFSRLVNTCNDVSIQILQTCEIRSKTACFVNKKGRTPIKPLTHRKGYGHLINPDAPMRPRNLGSSGDRVPPRPPPEPVPKGRPRNKKTRNMTELALYLMPVGCRQYIQIKRAMVYHLQHHRRHQGIPARKPSSAQQPYVRLLP